MSKFNPNLIAKDFNNTASEMKEKLTQVPVKKMIPLDQIDFHPQNAFRDLDNSAAIEDLAHSIEAHGLYHDIYVYHKKDGRYLVISGEKRCKAFRLLRRPAISATVVEGGLSDDELLLRLYEANLDTRPLSLEQRIAYIRKLKESLSEEGKKNFHTHIERLGKAFQVSDRQVQKLVAVSENLIPRLVTQLTEKNAISINEAASYSTSPEIFQNAVAEVLEQQTDLKEAKNTISVYLRKVKSNISLYKQNLAKVNVSLKYAQERLEQLPANETAQIKRWSNTKENCELESSELNKKIQSKVAELSREMQEVALSGTQITNNQPTKNVQTFSSFQRYACKMKFLDQEDRRKVDELISMIQQKYFE